MSEKLLPCPFCGNTWLIKAWNDIEREFVIACDGCEIEIVRPTKEMATKDWNKRVARPVEDEPVDPDLPVVPGMDTTFDWSDRY